MMRRDFSALLGLPATSNPVELILFSPFRQPGMMSLMPLVRRWADGESTPFADSGIKDQRAYESAVDTLFAKLCGQHGCSPPAKDDALDYLSVAGGQPTAIFFELSSVFSRFCRAVQMGADRMPRLSECIRHLYAPGAPEGTAIANLADLIGDYATKLLKEAAPRASAW